MELRGVGESNLRGLFGNGLRDFADAVANVDNGGLAGSVEIFLTVGRNDPGTFAADGDGKRFFEIAGKKSGKVCGHNDNCSRDIYLEGTSAKKRKSKDLPLLRAGV